jgi:3-oxoadipate enol-lactonase
METKNPTTPMQSGFAKINGANLYYEIAGTGEAVVLIHGFGLDLRMWEAEFTALAQTRRVLRYDVRGFGRSSLPDGTPYTHAEDLKLLLNILNVQTACLVGLSIGGRIALDTALTYPEKINGLVLVDSALNGFGWSAEWNALWEEMARAGSLQGARAANDLWLAHPLFEPARQIPSVKARLTQMVGDYTGWHWHHPDSHRRNPGQDSARLGEINTPTLELVGERDWPDFHAIAKILADGIPTAKKVIMPGLGHMSNMEGPEQFLAVLDPFLNSL